MDFFITPAQAQAAAGGTAGTLTTLLPLVLIFVVFYFLLIRPQTKRMKQHQAQIAAVKKGDRVVTGGGLIGKVSKMGESYLHVEIANGVEIQVQRGAIVQVLPKGTFK
jgi:preprotein translocase subunit YajC